MLKVFLVEDERIMREGLRDSIPWEKYGYVFVGEASDGEMALPLIRKTRPDVLITDIKMPFMDGLALSQIVSNEFPATKIIIISGYDDFEYARQAIDIGVEQYLLKPVTRTAMQKVLSQVSDKIENEKMQNDYLEKYREDYREYEQLAVRHFFEKVFDRKLSVKEMYEEASKLSIDLNAPAYDIALVYINENPDELVRYFMRFKEYLIFRWNISTYCILILGDTENIEILRDRCVKNIVRICESFGEDFAWYVATGTHVERLSLLPECFAEVNNVFSYRFLKPSMHVITGEDVANNHPGNTGNYKEPELSQIDPEIIKGFLVDGQASETEVFAGGFADSLADALESKMFRDYLILNIRFTVLAFVSELGVSKEEFLENTDISMLNEMSMDSGTIKTYIRNMLDSAIAFRDKASSSQYKGMIKKALAYIDENFTDDSLSLNAVAGYSNVSPNYFSGIFSNEMDMTFVEYVTSKRMELAKKLLKTTNMHTGEIAGEVGYKDQHYFSVVFKKTQGMSPRDYRNS
ncbi:MAG: response regulator [Lachnospiraceae bacterium]|nr:response regulator [Lachnospiraceae bacterium]